MDKHRFLLIVLFGIVLIIFLYTQYTKIKNETLLENQNLQTITQKIKKINYLQNIYNPHKLHLIHKCKISTNNKYIINCTNLNPSEFKKVSNQIFNANLNIIKFSITQTNIYVEISQ